MILSLVGDEPSEVSATGGSYLHQTIADVTTTHMAFPGGERAHVFVSWLHPFKEQKLVVIGDRAMGVFDDGAAVGRKLLIYPHRIEWRDALPLGAEGGGGAGDARRRPSRSARVPTFPRVRSPTGAPPRTDGQRRGARVAAYWPRASASLRNGIRPDAVVGAARRDAGKSFRA